ncbi:MAG: hypothetical protein WCK92_14455 [Bacteroidota bacterium]
MDLFDLKLDELKLRVKVIAEELESNEISKVDEFIVNGFSYKLYFTKTFFRNCKKNKIWNTPGFLTALKNTKYGFNRETPRSIGGKDGIFVLDRYHKPKNSMQHKIFDRLIDNPDSKLKFYLRSLGLPITNTIAIRIVSHHLRLLGILVEKDSIYNLVLLDCDNEKEK